MALNNLGLGIVFTASDLASGTIGRLARNFGGLSNEIVGGAASFDKFTPKVNVLAAGLKRLAVGAGVAAVGMAGLFVLFDKPVKEAADLETVMTSVGIKANLTGKQVSKLTDDFLELSSALPLSAAQLAKVGVVAGQLGIADPDQIKVLALRASQLFRAAKDFGSEENAAKLLARLNNLMGLDIKTANKLGSALIDLGDNTQASASEIANATVEFAGSAKTFDLSASAAAAFAATMLEGGVKTQVVGSSMTKLLSNMSDKTGEFAKVIGITKGEFETMFRANPTEALTRFIGALRGVDKLAKASVLKKLGLSDIRARKGIDALALGYEKLQKNLKLSNKSFKDGTSLQDKFERSTKDMNSALDTFKGTIQNIKIAIGRVLLPFVTKLLGALNSVAAVFLSLPESTKKLLIIGVIVASISTIIAGFIIMWPALVLAIKTAAAAIGSVLGITAGAAAAIFFKIVLVVGLVVAALFVLKKAWDSNFGGIQEAVLPVVNKIKLAFQSLFALLTKGEISGALADEFMKAENGGVRSFVEGFMKAFSVIKAVFVGSFRAIGKAFAFLAPSFGRVFTEVKKSVFLLLGIFGKLFAIVGKLFGFDQAEAGIDSIEAVAGAIQTIFITPLVVGIQIVVSTIEFLMKVLNGLFKLVDTLAAPFVGLAGIIGGVFNIVIGILSGSFSAVMHGVTQTVNGAIDLMNGLIEAAKQATLFITPDVGGARKAVADSFEGVKLDRLSTADVAFALGASDKTVAELTLEAKQRAGIETPGPAAKPPATTATATIPSGAPESTSVSLTNADVVALIEASKLGDERGRNVVVSGEVILDGHKVGRMRAADERDSRARRGRHNTAFGE